MKNFVSFDGDEAVSWRGSVGLIEAVLRGFWGFDYRL